MPDTVRMSDNTPRLLTVAVTSRALFDLEESHRLFESEGVEAYSAYQRDHEDDNLILFFAHRGATTNSRACAFGWRGRSTLLRRLYHRRNIR